mmetsp:Transcript_45488/g.106177  ORF Transcript_45488/g.106177 Transcript_45488/m.106177 type:complete len:289 (-) Transcript_45488:454-1320(-)
MTPPQTTIASECCVRRLCTSSGRRVRWPAACELTPTTCTSASIACIATSSGVAKSGPTSTSKPRSANADAMTLAPRSWPSCPILATRMRGCLPCRSANLAAAAMVASTSPSVSPNSTTYDPEEMECDGVYRPHCFSRAAVISPTVQRARAASIASSSKLPSYVAAAALSDASASAACDSLRVACSRRSCSTCASRTAELSITLGSTTGCSRPGFGSNLLTPTITSEPESMRACLRVADCSMRVLGIPDATATAIPPISSISTISAPASRTSSSVSASIMKDPPQGSTT